MGGDDLSFWLPVALVVLTALVVINRGSKHRAVRHWQGEKIPLLGAESIARKLLRGHLVLSIFGIALVAPTISLGALAIPFAFILGVMPVIGLLDVWTCRNAIRLLEEPDAVAERRGDWLMVRSPKRETLVQANERLFRLAETVPAAGLRRDD